eukprot:m.81622 g.81622  ORF g.81622 m.81622 type:complete len:980 (+) comp13371_c0_seq2:34-2973(+)
MIRVFPVASLDGPPRPKGGLTFRLSLPRSVLGKPPAKWESQIVRAVFVQNGFVEVESDECLFYWTHCAAPSSFYGMLKPYQRINHFPCSREATRKDCLAANLQRMQDKHGRAFEIAPKTFQLPSEFRLFYNEWSRDRGVYIAKPAALSQGRGICLVDHPEHVPLDTAGVISRYLTDPFLIDGFKFDIRLYVAVTSYQPLRIYLFEDGLVRFATVKFDPAPSNYSNLFMHLTNYSINKHSPNYVTCNDSAVEDYGNKWSLSALLQHLDAEGHDVAALMARIEDVIIKTLVAVQEPVVAAVQRHLAPGAHSVCGELYGFDILLDSSLRPWVLEVNLSPSLACEAPLDLKIKSHVVADFLDLMLLDCNPPRTRKAVPTLTRVVPRSSVASERQHRDSEFKRAEAEAVRCEEGGFQRIFPDTHTWVHYGAYIADETTCNAALHAHLFPDSASDARIARTTAAVTTLPSFKERLTKYKRTLPMRAPQPDDSDSQDDESPQTGSLPRGRTVRKEEMSARPPLGRAATVSAVAGPAKSKASLSAAAAAPAGPAPKASTAPFAPTQVAKQGSAAARPASPRDNMHLVSGFLETDVRALLGGEAADHPLPSGPVTVQSLTVLQARAVLSCYLRTVSRRLLSESLAPTPPSARATRLAFLDLLVRFMQRAAAGLPSGPRFVVLSDALPIEERQRIFALQLSEFLAVYDRETTHMQHTLRDQQPSLTQSFLDFLATATEHTLEATLNDYTRLHGWPLFLDAPGTSATLSHAHTQSSSTDSKLSFASHTATHTSTHSYTHAPAPAATHPATHASGMRQVSLSKDSGVDHMHYSDLSPHEAARPGSSKPGPVSTVSSRPPAGLAVAHARPRPGADTNRGAGASSGIRRETEGRTMAGGRRGQATGALREQSGDVRGGSTHGDAGITASNSSGTAVRREVSRSMVSGPPIMRARGGGVQVRDDFNDDEDDEDEEDTIAASYARMRLRQAQSRV